MGRYQNPDEIDVLAPNFKRRLSGVTATVVRLVPLQARSIAIAAVAPALPDHVPQIRLRHLLTLSRRPRVWHARRNTEMLAGLALKYLLGKRLKLLFTSASQRAHTGYSRWLISRMDAVIATSGKTAGYLQRPATTILHGIDTTSFTPPENKPALKAEMGLPPGPLIGCYGRIRAQKGTDAFVEAMIDVLPSHPEACAIIMGRATREHEPLLADLKSRVDEAGLTDRILFKPEVPVHEIARWYQALDLFVAPQRWEGFGLTPLEAMACAVPCIATRVGAFEDIILPDRTGALIPAGDIPAMAEAATRYLANTARLARHGDKARAHVVQNFDIQREADAITAIYRDLLAQS